MFIPYEIEDMLYMYFRGYVILLFAVLQVSTEGAWVLA